MESNTRNGTMSINSIAGWLLLLTTQALALGIPAVTMEDTLFEVSAEKEDVVMAAQLKMGTYAKNDFWSMIQQADGTWQDEFYRTPELLVVWNSYFARKGQTNDRSKLHAPAWYRTQVEGIPQTQLMNAAEVEAVLKRNRLIAKFYVGPYVLIVYDQYLPNKDRMLVTPVALRQFADGRYQITGEVLASSLAMYLGSLAPGVHPEVVPKARPLTKDDVRNLLVFEEVIEVPPAGEKYAPNPVHWRPEGAAQSGAEGRIYFYCKVDADPAKGYGLKVAQLASEERRSLLEPKTRRVCELLDRSFNVNNLEEQKTLWASAFEYQIVSKYKDAHERSKQISDEKAAREAIPGWRLIPPDSRLVARVPTEFGSYYYLDTRPTVEGFAQVVLVPDQNGEILSPALALKPEQRRAGMIDGILVRDTFKDALGQYLRQRYPTVLKAAESKPE
jgi:hypothetical protein